MAGGSRTGAEGIVASVTECFTISVVTEVLQPWGKAMQAATPPHSKLDRFIGLLVYQKMHQSTNSIVSSAVGNSMQWSPCRCPPFIIQMMMVELLPCLSVIPGAHRGSRQAVRRSHGILDRRRTCGRACPGNRGRRRHIGGNGNPGLRERHSPAHFDPGGRGRSGLPRRPSKDPETCISVPAQGSGPTKTHPYRPVTTNCRAVPTEPRLATRK